MAASRWSGGAAFVVVLGGALLLPATASADKISDAMAECRKKKAGDACSVAGKKGACVERSMERGNGFTKRWVECEPGKRPRQRPVKESVIDGAGPTGVLPGEPVPAPTATPESEAVEAVEAVGTSGAVGGGDEGAALPGPAAEPAGEAPVPAPTTPPVAADAEAPTPAAPEEARSDADAGRGCRLGGAGAPGGLLVLLLAGLRRRRARSPRA